MPGRNLECALVIGLVLAALPLCAQSGSRSKVQGDKALGGCNRSTGNYRRAFRNGAYVLTIAANPKAEEEPENACRAELRDGSGPLIFQTAGAGVLALVVEDVNGDRQPDLVLETFSGGAHCCWRYDIISVGDTAGLLAEFNSAHPAVFRTSKDKRTVIVTYSGAFDYFDGLCYACSPGAQVYLVLEGTRFRDVSPRFAKLYDESIAKARAELTPEKLAAFADTDPVANANPMWELNEVKQAVLTVVINYLYSGRTQEAWDAFAQMWPTADQPRMRALIEKTMGKGVLGSVAEWNERHK